ncbi:MAG: thiamine pyrophosphate-dependent dehydrogenase E1 component subunit alpha [Lachnospiraceae bacterium]|nr:thiamine pyrophosphate-dependent dehydrogenase E1 component subunit alpha [Lachnospiraceae bacterium]
MDRNLLMESYKNLVQQRYFQEKILDYGIGIYTEIGEEAITVGACAALEKSDIITCYFRGEGATLRYKGGISIKEQMCCWLGRLGEKEYINTTLPSAWTDVEHGVIGTSSSLIGADADIATGAALAQKKLGTGNVVVFMSGDGATSKGNFHEMFNWASRFQLPLMILVRGNGWAMSTPVEDDICVSSIADMVKPFGIRTYECDGNDVSDVYQCIGDAASYSRKGRPSLVYAKTYRISGHSAHDEDDYRDPAVLEEWKKKDPVINAENQLKAMGVKPEDINIVKEAARQEIDEAYEWALQRSEITVKQFYQVQQAVVNDMWGLGQEG